jgi:hypothetical protein
VSALPPLCYLVTNVTLGLWTVSSLLPALVSSSPSNSRIFLRSSVSFNVSPLPPQNELGTEQGGRRNGSDTRTLLPALPLLHLCTWVSHFPLWASVAFSIERGWWQPPPWEATVGSEWVHIGTTLGEPCMEGAFSTCWLWLCHHNHYWWISAFSRPWLSEWKNKSTFFSLKDTLVMRYLGLLMEGWPWGPSLLGCPSAVRWVASFCLLPYSCDNPDCLQSVMDVPSGVGGLLPTENHGWTDWGGKGWGEVRRQLCLLFILSSLFCVLANVTPFSGSIWAAPKALVGVFNF